MIPKLDGGGNVLFGKLGYGACHEEIFGVNIILKRRIILLLDCYFPGWYCRIESTHCILA